MQPKQVNFHLCGVQGQVGRVQQRRGRNVMPEDVVSLQYDLRKHCDFSHIRLRLFFTQSWHAADECRSGSATKLPWEAVMSLFASLFR
jgi:hypothetical protein